MQLKNTNPTKNFIRWLSISCAIALGFGSIFYALHFVPCLQKFYNTTKPHIEVYQNKDREAVLKLFKDNWYWLIPENSKFEPAYFLDTNDHTGRPNKSTYGSYQDKFYGPKTVRDTHDSHHFVYKIDNKVVGFASYYSESFYKMRLHFIVLDKDFRGKGIADELIEYVLKVMKKHGASVVVLVTRIDNIPAQKLYERHGFKPYAQDKKYIHFEKTLNIN